MRDETEDIRRVMVETINSVQSPRQELEASVGKVWDTDQIREEFEVIGFMAPFVVVKVKATGKKGSLEFQHSPRFYFNFKED